MSESQSDGMADSPIKTRSVCAWQHCRFTFHSNSDLTHHVLHMHASHAIPVLRRDLTMLRRAEEGIGESLSMTGRMTGVSIEFTNQEGVIQNSPKINPHTFQEIEPVSSLPSPPESSPNLLSMEPQELPSYPEDDPPTPVSNTMNGAAQSSSVPLVRKFIPPTTPQPQQCGVTSVTTPTFASLSSPGNQPLVPPIPLSPNLESLVKSVSISKKRKFTNGAEDFLCKKLIMDSNSQSHLFTLQPSHSSSGSVEKQLTQSFDIEQICEEGGSSSIPKGIQHMFDIPQIEEFGGSQESGRQIWSDLDASTSVLKSLASHELSMPHNLPSHDLLHPPSRLQLQSQTPANRSGKSSPALTPHHLHIHTQSSTPTPMSQMSPVLPLVSPSFVSSTPVAMQQAWYGVSPLLVHSAPKQRKTPEAGIPGKMPQNSFLGSNYGRQSKNVFRSGTLQTSSIASSEPGELEHGPRVERAADGGLIHRHFHHHTQPTSDYHPVIPLPQSQPKTSEVQTSNNYEWSSQPNQVSEDSPSQDCFLPPLQTQAPYQSQSTGMSY